MIRREEGEIHPLKKMFRRGVKHVRTMATGGLGAQQAQQDVAMRKFSLAGFEINSGVTLPAQAELAYRIYGSGEKLAVCGTSYSAVHPNLEFVVGTIIPKDYTFVVFNMLGNGVSYSPSNDPDGYPLYGKVTNVNDNIRAQKAALDADPELQGRAIDLTYGFSMGAMQALEWPRAFPDLVKAACAVCGSSGCTPYNAVFLDALITTLESKSTSWEDKIKIFAAIYAGWYVGPSFYLDEVYKTAGYTSLEDFESRFGYAFFKDMHPDDLLAQLRTWRNTPVFSVDDCKAIKANVLLLPCDGDTYFRLFFQCPFFPFAVVSSFFSTGPEDFEALEQKYIPNCTTKVIPSPWGHLAGTPDGLDFEFNFIKDELAAFLAK